MAEKKKTVPPPPAKAPAPAKPKPALRPLFKTLNSRVNFVVIFTAVALGAAAWCACFILRPAIKSDVAVLAAAVILGVIALWLAIVLGDLLIGRKTRRLVDGIREVVGGDRDPITLPRGLGELDQITAMFDFLFGKLEQVNLVKEQEIRTRLTALEIDRRLTELQQAHTKSLLTSIGEGVVAVDREGRISFINDVARAAAYWRAEKVAGVPIFDAFQLEDEKNDTVKKEHWPIWSAIRDGQTVITPAPTKPFYLRRKDSSRFPTRLTFSPVLLNGEVVGALAVFNDITDEVEFDRRKSEFISIASHQLRSPSSAVRMVASMLRNGDFGPLADKQKEWVEKLYAMTDSLLQLVNELLNISRVEAGVKVNPEWQDTAAFLAHELQQAEPLLLEKNQKFAFEKGDLPRLVFDAFMVGETLKNYLTNASKYSPAGGVITVVAEPTADGVRVAVKDQGMGIPRADYNQMFNKFFRAQNALKSTLTGTGLGLYYCKAAIEKHGGRVGFESTEGLGSTFWFTLPLKSPLEAAISASTVNPSEASGSRPDASTPVPPAEPSPATPAAPPPTSPTPAA